MKRPKCIVLYLDPQNRDHKEAEQQLNAAYDDGYRLINVDGGRAYMEDRDEETN